MTPGIRHYCLLLLVLIGLVSHQSAAALEVSLSQRTPQGLINLHHLDTIQANPHQAFLTLIDLPTPTHQATAQEHWLLSGSIRCHSHNGQPTTISITAASNKLSKALLKNIHSASPHTFTLAIPDSFFIDTQTWHLTTDQPAEIHLTGLELSKAPQSSLSNHSSLWLLWASALIGTCGLIGTTCVALGRGRTLAWTTAIILAIATPTNITLAILGPAEALTAWLLLAFLTTGMATMGSWLITLRWRTITASTTCTSSTDK